MTVRQAKTKISLGICPVWSESSLSAWRKLGSLATHWVHNEDWSHWADAQADLSLLCPLCHFVGFVKRWLNFCLPVLLTNKSKKMSSFKSNENIHKKGDGSYYVISANKASSMTL